MPKRIPAHFVALGALSAFLAVALGAIGAHTIAANLDTANKARWELAARYQIYHALALVLAGVWTAYAPRPRAARAAGWCFLAGTVLFSGSLYALAMAGRGGYGAITPYGGLAFLAGWLTLAWSARRHGRAN